MNITIKTLLLIVLLFIVNPGVHALGQAGTEIDVLKAGVGARPLGMGSAFTAIADNADAPYWNPAGLGFVDHNEITSSQTKLSTDADHYYLSYVRPAFGGTLGIAWIQIGLGSITETSTEVDSNNEVINIGIFSYFSNAYLISYGKKLNDKLSVGLTTKYLTSDMFSIDGGQATGYSLTPGLMYKFDNSWRLGIRLDELVNSQTWGTGTDERVPAKLRVGLAHVKNNPGTFALDISQTLKSGYGADLSVGYEWKRRDLSFRLGYIEGGLTAGAGFVSGHTKLDYAYVTQKSLSISNVHRISLSAIW
jgi:hypothetical protein